MTTAPNASARNLLRPPFVVSVLILATGAFAISPFLEKSAGRMYKEPLPLRSELGKLNKTIGPYIFKDQQVLNSAMVAALGTEEYISWHFIDTSVDDARNPLRHVKLFLTYYTGGRDLVPHVPDECLVGAGYQPTEAANMEIDIPSLQRSVPLRVLTFEKGGMIRTETPTVAYTFHCNGDFAVDRTTVRMRTSDWDEIYSYFCKIELSFGNSNSKPPDATRVDTIEAAERFLDLFLPLLLNNHLPDWEAAHSAPDNVAPDNIKDTAS